MNNVELIGRITRDPQVRYTSNTNMAIAEFALAIDRPTKDKVTDYPRVKVFGKQAENIEKYIHKGDMLGVTGSIATGSYEKDGKTVYYTEVIANRVEFVNTGTKHAETSEKRASSALQEEPVQESMDDFEELDDDVPF